VSTTEPNSGKTTLTTEISTRDRTRSGGNLPVVE
jgi:hypothetical protein